MKLCPQCGEKTVNSANRCDCGYNYDEQDDCIGDFQKAETSDELPYDEIASIIQRASWIVSNELISAMETFLDYRSPNREEILAETLAFFKAFFMTGVGLDAKSKYFYGFEPGLNAALYKLTLSDNSFETFLLLNKDPHFTQRVACYLSGSLAKFGITMEQFISFTKHYLMKLVDDNSMEMSYQMLFYRLFPILGVYSLDLGMSKMAAMRIVKVVEGELRPFGARADALFK